MPQLADPLTPGCLGNSLLSGQDTQHNPGLLHRNHWWSARDGLSFKTYITALPLRLTRDTTQSADPCAPGVFCSPPRQLERLNTLFDSDDHAAVEVTWSLYQHTGAAYRTSKPGLGKALMVKVINSIARSVPAVLPELAKLGRTLNKRRLDILAFFDHPRTSNGPTEAINDRLEHLRGTALGFRNLTSYIRKALLDTQGLRPQSHR